MFNQNVAPIDPSYTGKQYWYMEQATNRYSSNFLNERELFPQTISESKSFLRINDKTRLSSVFYWSGGSGGGTGTYGSVSRDEVEGKDGMQVHLGLGIE